jgi:sporadic carbohydrate cluster protein (TIGR04323 family)
MEPRVKGYVASIPVRGVHYPQRVQNLVVRDYCTRRGLRFELSATEYAMPGCYMVLESLLDTLDGLAGIVAFSAFMLPRRPARRHALYERLLGRGAVLHAALENLAVRSADDVAALEEMLGVASLFAAVPGRAYVDKADGVGAGPDGSFWDALAPSRAGSDTLTP